MTCKRVIFTCYLSIVSFALLAGRPASAQEFAAEPDRDLVALDDKISQFLSDVATGETESAFAALLEGSQLADQEKPLAALIEKTKELETKYGKGSVAIINGSMKLDRKEEAHRDIELVSAPFARVATILERSP